MKASAILLSGSLVVAAASVVVACGSTVSLEDLACPCATGFVCCDKVCVAEGSCGGDKLTVVGAGDGTSGGPTSGFGYADSGAGGFTVNSATVSSSASASVSSVVIGGSTSSASTGGTAGSSFCYYTSDAGYDRYNCSYENGMPESMSFACGCAGSLGSAAAAAQTDLSCMSGGGSIVAVCPSAGLVGCCTSSYGSFAGLGPYPDGYTVACSYGVDDHYELSCTGAGGTWSTTAPR